MKTLAMFSTLMLVCACTRGIEQRAHPKPPAPASQAADLASQDRDFLEKAARGNIAERSLGAITTAHAKRAEVIAYGEMLVRDHDAANAKLAAIAAAKGIAMPADLGEHQAAYDRVVERKLEPFDREFAKVMVEEHQQAVELYRAEAANGADAQLKAYAAATLPTIEAHLQQAEALVALVGQEP